MLDPFTVRINRNLPNPKEKRTQSGRRGEGGEQVRGKVRWFLTIIGSSCEGKKKKQPPRLSSATQGDFI